MPKINVVIIMEKMEKKAMKIYNSKLKILENLIGNDTTWLHELDKAGKKLFGTKFSGVYPSDKIPKLTKSKCYCILNLDKSGEPGSHWIALAKVKDKIMFYDSFGRKGEKLIPTLKLSGNGKIIDTQLDKEQKVLQTNCGARCLAWLWVFDECGSKVAYLI